MIVNDDDADGLRLGHAQCLSPAPILAQGTPELNEAAGGSRLAASLTIRR
jgi:hypothetical protein